MISKALEKKWMEALRSGDYKQGSGYLRKLDTFCCLGVLCELKKVDAAARGDVDGLYRYLSPVSSSTNINDAGWLTTDQGSCLAALNDSGWSFKRIADAIEFVGFKRLGSLLGEVTTMQEAGEIRADQADKILIKNVAAALREAKKRASSR